MSYKSLLFCPDEKTARVVTQVLSELEFTVELSGEPFATVKKLTDEHFDALVVDCQNEQDASLLFKAARNSSLNHSSLSVAVVEGQAGVAKAFRIGANLVLSKPVNVEQSKSTLRVARGLLRKNSEARAAAEGAAPGAKPASAPSISSSSTTSPTRPFAFDPANLSASSPAAIPTPAAPSAPYSALELDKDPTPAPEPSEAALLESMPNPIDGKPPSVAEHLWAPRSQGQAEPIAASTSGHGAAAAPAMARIPEAKLGGAAPMVTHEPIVAESGATEHFPVSSVPVPTFSMDLEGRGPSSGSGKVIKTIAVVLLFGVAGYLGWQKLQPLQYLPGSTPKQTVKPPVVAAEVNPTPAHSAQLPANDENSSGDPSSSPTTSSTVAPESITIGASSAPSGPAHTGSENVQVQEMPMNSEQRNRLAARPQPVTIQPTMTQPIVVQPNTVQRNSGSSTAPRQTQQPTPPPLSAASSSDAALANIVSTEAAKPALGSIRVSQGVSQGLVIKKVAPVYSSTALQLRKEGSVDLMATIGKDGAVTSVQVVKGDLLLANSAVDAVKQWKYRPYLLNGEPVEIQTQITVNFKLPH